MNINFSRVDFVVGYWRGPLKDYVESLIKIDKSTFDEVQSKMRGDLNSDYVDLQSKHIYRYIIEWYNDDYGIHFRVFDVDNKKRTFRICPVDQRFGKGDKYFKGFKYSFEDINKEFFILKFGHEC